MRVLVLGAAGRTGRHVVRQLTGHGHEVLAFTHQAPLRISHPLVREVTGDVTDFAAVDAAVAGCDAVVFAVGSGAVGGVRSAGISNVVHAMAVHEVDVVVALSAAGAFARNDSRLSLPFRIQIATRLRAAYDDFEAMEQRLAASGLAWTIVRPAGLTDGPQTGGYRISQDGALLPKASHVSRADVAALMVKAIETGAFARRTLAIAG